MYGAFGEFGANSRQKTCDAGWELCSKGSVMAINATVRLSKKHPSEGTT
jgi:hypothetical protein